MSRAGGCGTVFKYGREPWARFYAASERIESIGRRFLTMAKANDSGQTLVETAISLSIFLLLVLGTIDFGYLISTKVTLQNAVRQGGRYAITGQCITGSDGSCSMTRYNSIMQVVENTSLGVAAASEIQIRCTDNGGGCPTNAGGPGDVVTITVTHPYHYLSGPIGALLHNSITLTVSSAFTNEAFPPSQS
jgi:Flp pilus assembly protein TadG